MNNHEKSEFIFFLILKKFISLYNRMFYKNKRYRPKKISGKKVLSSEEGNKYLYDTIISGKPFVAARYGSTEISGFIEGKKQNLKMKSKTGQQVVENLSVQSGFFPVDTDLLNQFSKIYENCSKNIDILATYATPMENYMVSKYLPKNSVIVDNRALEPYYFSQPWSSALKGKKVLVIHPFEDSIIFQYNNNRVELFDNKCILPKFELKTLKAVQTIVGAKDERFSNWFEALDYMYKRAMNIDFDIALIGCGAYGLPLASMLREQGKQAIHIGGALQIIFGIKGKRWELNSPIISKMFNSFWIRPNQNETPTDKDKNEFNGAYW